MKAYSTVYANKVIRVLNDRYAMTPHHFMRTVVSYLLNKENLSKDIQYHLYVLPKHNNIVNEKSLTSYMSTGLCLYFDVIGASILT